MYTRSLDVRAGTLFGLGGLHSEIYLVNLVWPNTVSSLHDEDLFSLEHTVYVIHTTDTIRCEEEWYAFTVFRTLCSTGKQIRGYRTMRAEYERLAINPHKRSLRFATILKIQTISRFHYVKRRTMLGMLTYLLDERFSASKGEPFALKGGPLRS